MLECLTRLQMEAWNGYVFSREPLNARFDDEQRARWLRQSVSCGRQYAEGIKRKYGTGDPLTLAEEMGLNVSYPQRPENADRVLFAEYKYPDNIYIYMDVVHRAEVYLRESEIREILSDQLDVKRLLLAHELFHYLEEKDSGRIFTKQETVCLWRFGPIHNDSSIHVLGEIAAMAFARELTGISYSPYVMDVFLVYCYSPEEASRLFKEIMDKV